MSVKVKMLTLAAGPSGVFPAGTVRDVSGDEARELIAGGFAELVAVAPPAAKPVEEETETAMVEALETTARPKGRARGRR